MLPEGRLVGGLPGRTLLEGRRLVGRLPGAWLLERRCLLGGTLLRRVRLLCRARLVGRCRLVGGARLSCGVRRRGPGLFDRGRLGVRLLVRLPVFFLGHVLLP
ncbi:hypothetical protein GCM10027199_71000 [Amycolatopsis magusensis]